MNFIELINYLRLNSANKVEQISLRKVIVWRGTYRDSFRLERDGFWWPNHRRDV